jgi:hypothetical protein
MFFIILNRFKATVSAFLSKKAAAMAQARLIMQTKTETRKEVPRLCVFS